MPQGGRWTPWCHGMMSRMSNDGAPAPKHAGTPGPEDNATGTVAWLIRASMFGALLGFVAALFGNVPILIAGVVVLIAGCVAVGVLVFQDAQRRGEPSTRSLRRAFGAALGWLYDYH